MIIAPLDDHVFVVILFIAVVLTSFLHGFYYSLHLTYWFFWISQSLIQVELILDK